MYGPRILLLQRRVGERVNGALKHPERLAVGIRGGEREGIGLVAAWGIVLAVPIQRARTGIARCALLVETEKDDLFAWMLGHPSVRRKQSIGIGLVKTAAV